VKKIKTLYKRDPEDRRYVTFDVEEGCEWVLAGEGVPTRKYDGTCTMLDGEGKWWARREVKPGKEPPPNYVAEDHDPVTGKWQGWEPIEQSAFAKFHAEALANADDEWDTLELLDRPEWEGTYELIGPKINGNPEDIDRHLLVAHARAEVYRGNTPSPVEMVIYAGDAGWEGIVWHHPDGRMAKLKVRDLKVKTPA
jgi:hypothetical protein